MTNPARGGDPFLERSPSELLGNRSDPRSLRPNGLTSKEVADWLEVEHRGEVRTIERFALLTAATGPGTPLVYLGDETYIGTCGELPASVVITTSLLAEQIDERHTVLVTARAPRADQSLALEAALERGRFERLAPFRSPSARIAESAVVATNAWLGDDVVIEAGVVICDNTYLGPRVRIKANSVVGGDGLEVSFDADGRRRVVPHAGGVWIDGDTTIGSCTAVDRGLFGEFTRLGSGTIVDNLVHIAHGVRTGSACTIVASAEISGSVTFGDGVWLGPRSCVKNGLTIGRASYIGLGAVVTRSIPDHSLAYGSPARVAGRVCECRGTLALEAEQAHCTRCGRRYKVDGSMLVDADARVVPHE